MIHLKLISEHARKRPQSKVFVDQASHMTWEMFRQETERKVSFLLDHYQGLLPKQASYVTANRIDLMPWLAALSTLGIPTTGLDYTLPLSALKSLNAAIGAELILLSTNLAPQLKHFDEFVPGNAMAFDLDSVTSSFIDGMVNIDVLALLERQPVPVRPYRAVGFTSGTTSLPKPVVRLAPFDQRRFAYFAQRYGFNEQDRFLSVMPAYHAAGNGWTRLFLTLGATVYLDGRGVVKDWGPVLAQEGITATVMTPVLLSQLLDQAQGQVPQLAPALRWLLVGGKHFSVELKQRALQALGPCVHEYYGTTETGVNTMADPADLASHPGSVGRAYDGNDVAIVDATNKRLPALQSGRIAVDSYMNMASYGDGQAPVIELDGQRFLLTPDKGYFDEQGRLFLLNRSDNPHNHVNLYRLEDAIRAMPGVADVAILSSGAQAGDETFVCALTVRPSSQAESSLLSQVQCLAQQESVTFDQVRVLPSIPYSPSGKVRARDLAALLVQAPTAPQPVIH